MASLECVHGCRGARDLRPHSKSRSALVIVRPGPLEHPPAEELARLAAGLHDSADPLVTALVDAGAGRWAQWAAALAVLLG